MNISYKWLKEYLNLRLTPEQVADQLTSIGLETGSVEQIESVRGALRGLVIGKVLTCLDHPDSDHLHVTTVDVGSTEPLQIVCGAPNVAAGQTVVVATVGTILYNGQEQFTIKRSKIRGVESFGMICAEDEIGVGSSHDGIIVLPEGTPIGMAAAEYYNVESDYVLEVDITPNRADATSHYGVARDLYASLSLSDPTIALQRPSVDHFKVISNALPIQVEVVDSQACPRYAGVTIKGVKVAQSPEWLKSRLQIIGLRPINNVVDVTNFVLHELGQPLHAFDAAHIKGGKIIVTHQPQDTPFVTLDEVERKLSDKDLMICNTQEPMCIAGVFGGLHSGVTLETTDVFLESAYFNPVSVRKTARRHGLNTDSSFRFERGIDPNITLYALKRAALLIQEVASGEIAMDIVDIYPDPIAPFRVDFSYSNCDKLIGKQIAHETIDQILRSLEIEIMRTQSDDHLTLLVPAYRVDVQRECDVIEDILRIYGYNNIELTRQIRSTLSHAQKPDNYALQTMIAQQLVGAQFYEILNNSLTSSTYYQPLTSYPESESVMLINGLSKDLNCMRQSLLFGGLESLAHNINRRNGDLRFFEFGNCYHYNESKRSADRVLAPYREEMHLGLWMTGMSHSKSWTQTERPVSFFDLKAVVETIFTRLGLGKERLRLKQRPSDDIFVASLAVEAPNGALLALVGVLLPKVAKRFDLSVEVFYADLFWSSIIKQVASHRISYGEVSKYPEVVRDLALLVDVSVSFGQIEKLVYQTEKKLIQSVSLFDVYEGKNLPAGKKSYAISITLQDREKTLTDQQIDAIMSKIIQQLDKQLGASLR